MSQDSSVIEGTFRDPAGRLYRDGDRILREVYPQYATSVFAWLRSPVAERWIQQGRMNADNDCRVRTGEAGIT
jgi:hypothetical protein